jgi:hypothetical protein
MFISPIRLAQTHTLTQEVIKRRKSKSMNAKNEIILRCLEEDIETTNARNEIEELMDTIKSMNLEELDRLLDEELNNNVSGKYFILATLRDLFINYEKLGDTELTLELGYCEKNCYKNACKVFNLSGKDSGKDFAFVIEKNSDRISGIHLCPSFTDSNDVKRPIDNDLYYDALKKDSEMRKKRKSNWDDEKSKKLLNRLRKF